MPNKEPYRVGRRGRKGTTQDRNDIDLEEGMYSSDIENTGLKPVSDDNSLCT
jgi:hypothetical protein